ncbi:DMT family transporter [Marinomonas sp. PE14-40]|uniref:DMT family transporter n=1 Tax=Marinomonas sp. PE14-40 TaxID=3060621 RepID=UPI003F676CD9
MNNTISLVVIAAFGGFAVALQGQFMGIMDRSVGTSGSMFVNYISGAVVACILLLIFQGDIDKSWGKVPWYAFSAGILGLVIAGTIGYTVPRLGLSTAFVVVVSSQFFVSIILDHFGWFGASIKPIDMNRLVGVTGLLVSVWLITK